ncbi:MAG: hypothetical protein H0W42_06700 [Gemmatimonadaceae bacterium]|nr:hypothetical protein [Gemmatimonadaceae bacterium]
MIPGAHDETLGLIDDFSETRSLHRDSSGKMERAISCVHVADTERHSGHA